MSLRHHLAVYLPVIIIIISSTEVVLAESKSPTALKYGTTASSCANWLTLQTKNDFRSVMLTAVDSKDPKTRQFTLTNLLNRSYLKVCRYKENALIV